MHEEEIRGILQSARRIAILGANDSPGRPVDGVGRYLLAQGYEIFPVHPVRKTVWGLTVYKTLKDVPGRIDGVNLFRAAEHCPGHARETLALSPLPTFFWMQLGISSPEAGALLAPHGVFVVENACIMVEHKKLFHSSLS